MRYSDTQDRDDDGADTKGQKIPLLVIKQSVLSDVLYDRVPLSETGDALITSFVY